MLTCKCESKLPLCKSSKPFSIDSVSESDIFNELSFIDLIDANKETSCNSEIQGIISNFSTDAFIDEYFFLQIYKIF